MSKEVAANIRAIADALKPTIEIDPTTGVATAATAEDVFAQFLPDTITMDTVKDVQGALIDFAAGQTLAHGEMQINHLSKHPELKSGSLSTKIGHSTFESSIKRETSGTAMGKPWRKQGVAVTDVVLGSGRKKSDYNNVVAHLAAHAESVFAN